MVRTSACLFLVSLLAVACGSKPVPSPEVPPAPSAPLPPIVDAGAPPLATAADAGAPIPDPPPPPAVPGSKKISQKHDAAWAGCHSRYKPTSKDLSAEATKSAKGCEAVTKMKAVGPVQKGTQSDHNPPQMVKLDGKAGKCYRVYAMADAGIKDLDLLLKDSTGAIASEDSTDDPSPVLVEDGAFCFTEADAATLVVSVGEGKGNWALQIWSD